MKNFENVQFFKNSIFLKRFGQFFKKLKILEKNEKLKNVQAEFTLKK